MGTGPLFDFHRAFVESYSDAPGANTHPVNMGKLMAQPENHSPVSVRQPFHSNDETMLRSDAHSMNCCRKWPSVEHRPHKTKVLVTARNTQRREAPVSTLTDNISAMTRGERIRLLEDMGTEPARNPLEATPGVSLTARRAHQERQALGIAPLGEAIRAASMSATGSKTPRALHVKRAQLGSDDGDYDDDGFCKAVEEHRAAFRRANAPVCPEERVRQALAVQTPATSSDLVGRKRYPRVSPKGKSAKSLLAKASQHDEALDLESMSSWLAALTNAVEEGERKTASQGAYSEESALFVKLCDQLQSCAYMLRPHDALRALKLTARSAALLQSYQRAVTTRKYDAEACRVAMVNEDALASVRIAMEAILSAIATRIVAAEAPYLAETMIAMAETCAGRQEFLDAMLGHMLWLLAAKPRTFQPQVVAQIYCGLGRMTLERGADDETLSAVATDANRRAVASLEARLVETLDDFLEEDLGILTLDPSGGALLSDTALRRVLQRAGRLQLGLGAGSTQFHEGVRCLALAANERLWEPYQAEIMPFMREYCERILAANSAAGLPVAPGAA